MICRVAAVRHVPLIRRPIPEFEVISAEKHFPRDRTIFDPASRPETLRHEVSIVDMAHPLVLPTSPASYSLVYCRLATQLHLSASSHLPRKSIVSRKGTAAASTTTSQSVCTDIPHSTVHIPTPHLNLSLIQYLSCYHVVSRSTPNCRPPWTSSSLMQQHLLRISARQTPRRPGRDRRSAQARYRRQYWRSQGEDNAASRPERERVVW